MTGGALGDAPEVYWTIRAARYLRVPPWDLGSRPTIWEDLALATERAELYARDHHGEIGVDEG